MLRFKGAYAAGTTYHAGDVVIYADDGRVYHMHTDAAAGTSPHNTRYWQTLDGVLTEAVRLMNDAMGQALNGKLKNNLTTTSTGYALDARQGKALNELIEAVSEQVGAVNPDAKTLQLASSTESSTKVFDITVDDDGEITATEHTA